MINHKPYIPEKVFKVKGYEYTQDRNGVVHQLNPQPFVYDSSYVSTYDTEQYKKESDILMSLRLGFIYGVVGGEIKSLLDYGYGNGSFLKIAQRTIPYTYGLDVTGIDIPGSMILNGKHTMTTEQLRVFENNLQVYTFWDSLEHLSSFNFLQYLTCEYVFISLPYCHLYSQGIRWFADEYPHLKPNEHLHHFTPVSLSRMMYSNGWKIICTSNLEDAVRKSKHGLQNIITAAFRRI